MFGLGPWQDVDALRMKLAEVQKTAAEARRSRLDQVNSKQNEPRGRGYWCLCIRKPRLLAGGRNG